MARLAVGAYDLSREAGASVQRLLFCVRLWLGLALALVASVGAAGCGEDVDEGVMILATTTSLNDSGLLDELVPLFEVEEGVEVKVIAVGTGAALRMAEEGAVDTVLAHAPEAERALLAGGHVTSRTLVAYNDFLFVGPVEDPAGVVGMTNAAAALLRIADEGADFASRGDDSGTHKKELSLWGDAGIDPSGEWYLEVGQGMSATLTVADQRAAYVLTDRGTFLSVRRTLSGLVPLVEGDARLLNFYSALVVDGEKGGVNVEAAEAWTAFLTREDIQRRIGEYRRDEFGRSLFVPAAGESEEDIGERIESGLSSGLSGSGGGRRWS